MSRAMSRPFLKMNGLGNDFVVVEARSQPFAPSAEEVRAIADRERGIGCDQLISLEPAAGEADVRVRFWNADGEEVGAEEEFEAGGFEAEEFEDMEGDFGDDAGYDSF